MRKTQQKLKNQHAGNRPLEENARGGQKKSPEVQLFRGHFFQHRLTVF